MVTLTLGARDLAQVRFAFSPLWECVAAFRVWQDPARHAVHLPWAAALDRAVGGRIRRRDWALLDAVARPPSGAIPDFLAPPPRTPLARFDEELAAARRTRVSVIRRELAAAYPSGLSGHVRADIANLFARPTELLARVTDQLEAFWEVALAPAWGRVATRLEAEVIFRARGLAMGGPEALFNDLHATVRFVATHERRRRRPGGDRATRAVDRPLGTLQVQSRETYARHGRGVGVLLVPSVFAWPDVFVAARPPWRPTIAYPARGVAELWAGPSTDADRRGSVVTNAARTGEVVPSALAALLGAPRARVLAALASPHSPTELAAALALAPATASEQVTALWRAGVVDRTRVGRRVFYVLNGRGREVLGVMTEASNAVP